ncbi:hypothetical protein [Actinomadura sp. 3N407]|uniref:hypothetical protein n=1 Tax=Actinomadura sp. 3N407 TaxID=3457423 RepID=UPI003FCD617D
MWIEASISWFIGEFGRWPSSREIVLPSPELLSGRFTGTPDQIDGMVEVVCGLMGIGRSALTVELFDRAGGDESAVRKERRAVEPGAQQRFGGVPSAGMQEPAAALSTAKCESERGTYGAPARLGRRPGSTGWTFRTVSDLCQIGDD